MEIKAFSPPQLNERREEGKKITYSKWNDVDERIVVKKKQGMRKIMNES